MFVPGDNVYVNQPPTAKTASERIADESRSELSPRNVRPFQIINTMSHTITISEDDIAIVISIDRATLARDWKAHLQSNNGHPTHNATYERPRPQELRLTEQQDTYP